MLRMKIIFLILLELVLSRGTLCYDSNEEYIDRDDEISANVDEVVKVIASIRSKKMNDDGKSATILQIKSEDYFQNGLKPFSCYVKISYLHSIIFVA